MQTEQQEVNDGLEAPTVDSAAVMQFLTLNPEFFNQHSEVLPRLRIPHHTGAAVSLIEKQVSVLRNKCATLEHSLRDLISVARENEQLHNRLHRLIQDIISSRSLEDVMALTRDNLLSNFNADDVRFVLITAEGTADINLPDHREIPADDPGLELFADIFKKRDTRCGELSEQQQSVLFGDEELEVGSAAIIPLYHDKQLGMVVLTSKDETRFTSNKGVMFLNQLGEVLSRRVHSLL